MLFICLICDEEIADYVAREEKQEYHNDNPARYSGNGNNNDT
jgi:hypothetical protein